MRVSQCVVCSVPLPVSARSHRRYCKGRCRVRAHRFRMAGRSVLEADQAQRSLHEAQIEELSQALRDAEQKLLTATQRNAQSQLREEEQVHATQKQESQHLADTLRLKARIAELETQSHATNESLVQATKELADVQREMAQREAGMMTLISMHHSSTLAEEKATQYASTLQRKLRELETELAQERSRNRNRAGSTADIVSDEVVRLQKELAQRDKAIEEQHAEAAALRGELAQIEKRLADTESELALMKQRHEEAVADRKHSDSAALGLRSQVDAMNTTILHYQQRDLATMVVGGVGALSTALSAVAAKHGTTVAPLNVAELLKLIHEPHESPPKDEPTATSPEPQDEWRQIVGEQLIRGWRPENDELLRTVRAVMAAEAELELVKSGKSPLPTKPQPSVEQDYPAMERTLRARHECAKRSGKETARAWWRPKFALVSYLEHSLHREYESQLARLREEVSRRFWRR